MLTVSEITRLVKTNLESSFPRIWVEGEVSNFHRHHSGHLYFTLKDENTQLRAVMFRSGALKVKFEMGDGLQVVCRGRINVYEPRGEYQLLAEVVEPKGKGALQLAFEQLKEKLKNEGLFDPGKKKKLPLRPKKVGVITSPRGAAIIDIIRTLERRFGRVHILIYPVRVQGEGASNEIALAIDEMGLIPDIDVIIVGRGGGSIEDLWAFNEERVARAIFRCPIPVISAVGHEVDFTISDFVADIRASTPSAAAEMVVQHEQSFFDRIENLEKRIVHQLQYQVQGKKHDVLSLVRHQAFQNFKMTILNLAQKIDDFDIRALNTMRNLQRQIGETRASALLYEERMAGIIRRRLQDKRSRWEKNALELHALSPLNILKKGYTLCWKEPGQTLIRRAEDINEEEELFVSFYKGELRCLVKERDVEKKIESRIAEEDSQC